MSDGDKRAIIYENFLNDVGPLIPFFEDRSLTDIYVNPDGHVIVESSAAGKIFTDVWLDEYQATAIVISAAALFSWEIDPTSDVPKVEGVLPPPYKLRFTGILPPASTPQPAIALRRPSDHVISLEEYLERGNITREWYDLVCRHIEGRGNILVSGSTGSGKTTFTNGCIKKMAEVSPSDRFYIVEDVRELICPAEDSVMLFASHPESSASELVQESLRFTPKRIIFGELRYPQVAYDLVTAWSTGHSGNITTIHANDCRSSLARLNKLCNDKTGNAQGQLDFRDILSLCVHLKNQRGRRFVDEVLVINEI